MFLSVPGSRRGVQACISHGAASCSAGLHAHMHPRAGVGRGRRGTSAPSRQGEEVWVSPCPYSPGTGAQRLHPCHMTAACLVSPLAALAAGSACCCWGRGAGRGSSEDAALPSHGRRAAGLGLTPCAKTVLLTPSLCDCEASGWVVREAAGRRGQQGPPSSRLSTSSSVPCSSIQRAAWVSGTASSGPGNTAEQGTRKIQSGAAWGQPAPPRKPG